MKIHAADSAAADGSVWVPPGPGALDAKRDFGAVGDGKADDTAALQKALHGLLESSLKGESATLVLPPGTYRITDTLRMTLHGKVRVTGLDPATTRLVWDGPDDPNPAREAADGIPWPAMILADGVHWSVISRLTFDGRGKKVVGFYHAWSTKTRSAGTYNRHEDLVFTELHVGLLAGRSGRHLMDAETVVTRSTFRRCSGAGLVINSFNALDWWLWHCLFEDNAIGVTNQLDGGYGGGHFHVYESAFRRSKIADIQIGHASYFGIRWNRSEGSQMFLRTVRPSGWGPDKLGRWQEDNKDGSVIHLQGNAILDSVDRTPVRRTDSGPTIATDNVVRRKAPADGEPWAEMTGPGDSAFLAVGNAVFPAGGCRGGQVIEIDGTSKLPDSIPMGLQAGVIAPEAPGTIIDVATTDDGAALQAALDRAGELRGTRPVVRLPEGVWNSETGFTIPPGSDLILWGEGSRTRLARSTPGAVLTIPAATPVTLANLDVGVPNREDHGKLPVTGIACTITDAPDTGIWTDQFFVTGRDIGMDIAGLKNSRVELRNHQPNSPKIGMRLSGGRVGMFGGATSDCPDQYQVRDGAELVIKDTWYEGAAPTYLIFADRGRLTLDCGKAAPGRPHGTYEPKETGIDLRNTFEGSVTLLGLLCETTIRRSGNAELGLLGTIVDYAFQAPFGPKEPHTLSFGSFLAHAETEGASWKERGLRPLPPIRSDQHDEVRRLLADTRAALPLPPARKMVRIIHTTIEFADKGLTVNVP